MSIFAYVLGLKRESPIQVKENYMNLIINIIIGFLAVAVVAMIAINWWKEKFKVLQNNFDSSLILNLKSNSSDKHGILMHSYEPQANGHL